MRVVFYGKRNTGVLVLLYLIGRGFEISVIPEDKMVLDIADYFKLPIVSLDKMGVFDLFICCHGNKIIPKEYLIQDKFINIHPCIRYKGHDPIKRYIENEDTEASIDSHYMTERVDEGELIKSIKFTTPIVRSYAEFYNIAYQHYITCIHETLQSLQRSR